VNKLTKLLLGTTFALGIGSFYLYKDISTYPAPVRTEIRVVRSRNLTVNTDKSIMTLISKDELEGVRDMVQLIFTSRLEEAWIYLPEKKMWIEYGINEEASGTIDASLLLDLDIFHEACRGFNSMACTRQLT
jgi:hypothetical protein